MTEAELNKISLTLIFLITLSAHHIYFGKNIPKWSWRLAILFSFIAGGYIGNVMAEYPSNLTLGGAATLVILFINMTVRVIRNRQDDYFAGINDPEETLREKTKNK